MARLLVLALTALAEYYIPSGFPTVLRLEVQDEGSGQWSSSWLLMASLSSHGLSLAIAHTWCVCDGGAGEGELEWHGEGKS